MSSTYEAPKRRVLAALVRAPGADDGFAIVDEEAWKSLGGYEGMWVSLEEAPLLLEADTLSEVIRGARERDMHVAGLTSLVLF